MPIHSQLYPFPLPNRDRFHRSSIFSSRRNKIFSLKKEKIAWIQCEWCSPNRITFFISSSHEIITIKGIRQKNMSNFLFINDFISSENWASELTFSRNFQSNSHQPYENVVKLSTINCRTIQFSRIIFGHRFKKFF